MAEFAKRRMGFWGMLGGMNRDSRYPVEFGYRNYPRREIVKRGLRHPPQGCPGARRKLWQVSQIEEGLLDCHMLSLTRWRRPGIGTAVGVVALKCSENNAISYCVDGTPRRWLYFDQSVEHVCLF